MTDQRHPHQESIRPNGGPRRQLRLLVLAAIALPAVLFLDIVRPAILEQELLESIAIARGSNEPALDTVDYVVLAALLLVMGLVFALARAGHHALLTKCTLLAWAMAIPAIGAETLLTALGRPLLLPPGMKRTYRPDPAIMLGVFGPSVFTTNRLGMRAPEWEEEAYKILCVGGSTTICTYLDDGETWPGRLMTVLNERQTERRYWVGNLGKSGHATYHHIELLTRLPEAKRVDCCIVLCGVNDFEHAFRASDDVRRRLAPSNVFHTGGALNPTRPYLKQTHIYRWAKALLGRTALRNVMEIEDASGQVYVLRRQARQGALKDYPLPPLDAPLAAYRRNLARIVALCRERGVRCILMTQPTLWRNDLPPDLDALLWSRPIGNTGRAVSVADLTRGMAAYNRTMIEFCRAESVECIDLAAICPKDGTVFVDDEHFNESGARIVADAIADRLLRRDRPSFATLRD